MKIALVCAAAVALSIAACSSNNQSSTTTTPEASSAAMATPAGAPMGGNMHAAVITVVLAPLSGSGESGTATLTAMGDKTRVNIGLKGENATGKQPAHIHLGSCPKPGAVKYALKDVVLGKSNTVIDAPLASLTGTKYSINVHESAKDLAKYVACGNIK